MLRQASVISRHAPAPRPWAGAREGEPPMARESAETLPMPAAYFLLILREFGGTPASEAALLAETGIDRAALAAPGFEVTLGQQLRMLGNLGERLAPGWALDAGSGFHASTHGPLGFAVVSAPTLGASLDTVERFGWVRAPYYRIAAEREGGLYRIAVEERVPLEDGERVPLLEMLMLSLQALVESVLGRPMREAAFDFAYPAPSYAKRYGAHFHAPVRFGRTETRATLPAPWLALACPMADPAMYRTSLQTLEVQARRIEGEDYLLARLEQILGAAGDAGLPLGEAARRIHLSRRTLNRRLRGLGTSYRALLEAHLRERAEALLCDPGLPVAEVAWRLGYEDASNFGRACRRWFGMGPGDWRKRRLGDGTR